MGHHPNIIPTSFPIQGRGLGKRVEVALHGPKIGYFHATIVRDDMVSPFVTLLRLEDGPHEGQFVLATECLYSAP
jgi:hypothetical protein